MSISPNVKRPDPYSEAGYSKTAIAVVAVVLVIALAICLHSIWHTTAAGSGSYAQVATSQDTSNNALLTQLAKKSHGDFSKLSPSEQTQVNQITHGHGAFALQMIYQGNK